MENFLDVPTLLVDSEEFLPKYTTKGAAGADVRACLKEPLTIEPGRSALVPTGLVVEIPEGFEIQVRPRSGLALKNGITVLNAPGTIDADYRGEVKVILMNHGNEPFTVNPGDRIAQFVLSKVYQARFLVSELLQDTDRGGNGFGHTGHS